MTILVGMKYLYYAADTEYGEGFCDLPEPIKEAIEEYFDGMNLDKNPDSNPDNMWVNSFTEFDRCDAIWFAYGHELDAEEAEEYDEDELIEKIRENGTFLGKVDERYFVFQ